jgi:hypothetical protein
LFHSYLWCYSNKQMNVIWHDCGLINRKTALSRNLYPVVDQTVSRPGIKYPASEPCSEHQVMTQIEAGVRSSQNL